MCSSTLWVCPTNSPVSLGVSPAAASIPTGVFSQRLYLRLYFPALELWVAWSVSLPSCSSWFICTLMWGCSLCQLPPHLTSPPAATLPRVLSIQLPVSVPPTGLGECFFFNFLIVGLPYSSIFCQFWLFFVLKFVILLLVVRGGTVCLPTPPSWPEVSRLYMIRIPHQPLTECFN